MMNDWSNKKLKFMLHKKFYHKKNIFWIQIQTNCKNSRGNEAKQPYKEWLWKLALYKKEPSRPFQNTWAKNVRIWYSQNWLNYIMRCHLHFLLGIWVMVYMQILMYVWIDICKLCSYDRNRYFLYIFCKL